jgi:hypothetical protein
MYYFLVRFEGVQGEDYEECRLLVYKNPSRTSQETQYLSAIEPGRLTFEVFTAVTMKNAVF